MRDIRGFSGTDAPEVEARRPPQRGGAPRQWFGVAVVVLAGVALLLGGFLAYSGTRAAQAVSIGYVDLDRVADDYLRPQLDAPLREETDRLQKEFDAQAKGLNDQQKQQLFAEYQRKLEQRRQELVNARLPGVRNAIGQVAQEKGLQVVVDKNFLIWGGVDITEAVLLKLGVRSAPSK